MRIVRLTLNGQQVELNPDEIKQLNHIRAYLACDGHQRATQAWRLWIDEACGAPAQSRRLAAGNALGLGTEKLVEKTELLDEIRANRAKLNGCPLHFFDSSGIDWVSLKMPERFRCVTCCGWLPALQAVEYARGYAAAGGDANEILEGFAR